MHVSLQATHGRWWGAHRNQFEKWESIKFAMLSRFSIHKKNSKYIPVYEGHTSPQHVQSCTIVLTKLGLLVELWVNYFIHTLGTFLQAWYLKEEIKMHTDN